MLLNGLSMSLALANGCSVHPAISHVVGIDLIRAPAGLNAASFSVKCWIRYSCRHNTVLESGTVKWVDPSFACSPVAELWATREMPYGANRILPPTVMLFSSPPASPLFYWHRNKRDAVHAAFAKFLVFLASARWCKLGTDCKARQGLLSCEQAQESLPFNIV